MSSTTTQARAAQEADEWAQVRRELGGELDALEREVQQASVGVTTSTPPAVTPSYSAAADIGKTAASNFTAWRESAPAVAAEAAEAPKKKICCACPDTRCAFPSHDSAHAHGTRGERERERERETAAAASCGGKKQKLQHG